MKLWLLVLPLCVAFNVCAQDKKVEGIVYDKGINDRIARVNIRNLSNGQAIFNNLKGEFSIDAAIGDRLVFSKEGYFNDTVKITDKKSLAVNLKTTGIQLQEVRINDKLINPEKWMAATRRDYTRLYGPSANPDLLTTSPYGGAGIGIDALYNALSRSGRNAERLKEVIERDYHQNVIDYRFNRTYVANITGLKDDQLTDFMQKYRPGYYLVTTASDYEFVKYIRNSFKRYMRNPSNFTITPLEPAK
ncbi:hypothetical protein LJ707_18465 [Mucilaginibacter sp. UR6-1]|uniref:hypothetical protein n=1 Tax=Mucilaginibacter sp. UR6-1 TaxID=1435643 RepID=UPI001E488BF1|nr:hypothetical protein [Mucilaginibacter sp. UR6-1]MCC8410930.1 hypothetical protein [Mucilaginibacter sp. UR6-1]